MVRSAKQFRSSARKLDTANLVEFQFYFQFISNYSTVGQESPAVLLPRIIYLTKDILYQVHTNTLNATAKSDKNDFMAGGQNIELQFYERVSIFH